MKPFDSSSILRWSIEVKHPSVAGHADLVVIGGTRRLVCVGALDGRERWAREGWVDTIIWADEHGVVANFDNALVGYDWTGAEFWRRPPVARSGRMHRTSHPAPQLVFGTYSLADLGGGIVGRLDVRTGAAEPIFDDVRWWALAEGGGLVWGLVLRGDRRAKEPGWYFSWDGETRQRFELPGHGLRLAMQCACSEDAIAILVDEPYEESAYVLELDMHSHQVLQRFPIPYGQRRMSHLFYWGGSLCWFSSAESGRIEARVARSGEFRWRNAGVGSSILRGLDYLYGEVAEFVRHSDGSLLQWEWPHPNRSPDPQPADFVELGDVVVGRVPGAKGILHAFDRAAFLQALRDSGALVPGEGTP